MSTDDRTLPLAERRRLDQEAREKVSRKRRRMLDQFHDEEIQAANPDYLGMVQARSVFGARSDIKKARQAEAELTQDHFVDTLLGWSLKPKDVIDFVRNRIAPAFSATAALTAGRSMAGAIDTSRADGYVDERYEFGTTMVSQQTRRALEEESNLVAAKMLELRASKSADELSRREQELESLADKFEMLLHPTTKMYVHNINRVVRYEEKHNPHHLVCPFEVNAVRVRQDIGDTRQIKRAIADVYNEDPNEVQLNQSERVQHQARPVLPPHIRSCDL